MAEDGSGTGGYAREMSESYKLAQLEMTRKTCKECDIVITTALIPGRTAPLLVDEVAVMGMKPGSVIVDMAAESGGNCSLTKANEIYVHTNNVSIIGYTDLVSRMAP
jgi:NAD/NADP transhydrogenase alpha subunit